MIFYCRFNKFLIATIVASVVAAAFIITTGIFADKGEKSRSCPESRKKSNEKLGQIVQDKDLDCVLASAITNHGPSKPIRNRYVTCCWAPLCRCGVGFSSVMISRMAAVSLCTLVVRRHFEKSKPNLTLT